MSAKFEYDENGTTFFYFLLAFEALVVIPCTYYFLASKRVTRSPSEKERICHCDNCSIKNSRLRAKEPWRKAKQRLIKFLLLIAWILLFLTLYKVTTLTDTETITFDPFEILQIEADSSMAEIKRAYRKLSLLFHPDKSGGDEKRFMMIAKAYAALTQEEARKNYEQYGNPDGPGATSFGIALPAWIVDQENSLFVLGVYALLFMIALPIAVGCWWHKSSNLYTEAVLYATVKVYYRFICTTPHMLFKRVIMILAASLEFEHSHNNEIEERPSDNIEIPNLMRILGSAGLNEKNREKPLCFGYSIKARTLIYAHLSRLKLSNTLEEDKLLVIRKCPVLIAEFVSCTAQCTMVALAGKISRMPSLDTMENAMKLSPCIVQALWNHQNSLLQLPHLTEDMLKHFTTRKRNIRSIWHLASMHDDDRRAMLRCLTDDQYEDVINVMSNLPVVNLNVKSEVLDDEDSCTITAGAIVTVTVTLNRQNMSTLFKAKSERDSLYAEKDEKTSVSNGIENNIKKQPVWQKQKKKKGAAKPKAPRNAMRGSKKGNGVLPSSVPPAPEKVKEVKDDDSDSDKSDASSVKDSADENEAKDAEEDAEWDKFKKKDKNQANENNKSKSSHLVHCPFFPDNKYESWWLYIADKRRGALITNPFMVTTLLDKEDVELKFSAPSKPGLYSFAVILRSDSYVDFDVIKVLHLDVKEAKIVDITKVQWDVSEEEEEKDEESAVEDSDLISDDDIDDE